MPVRTPEELEGLACSRQNEDLSGPGVDYWKTWTSTNHFPSVTSAELQKHRSKSLSVLDTIKRIMS
ncbi:MAG: hypothetical protein H6876_06575 [Hyphomicrobiaceae bacterium]|nr:hypothetical protein [Hyphomicrobiaceae bacterium]MCC0007774.1 hypothetical protein [Hyphomicrobiaceae bacterium]